MVEPHILLTLSLVGLLLSLYAYSVEQKATHFKKYKALCDINKHITCSAVLSSKYGHLLGFSNSLFGIFFYFLVFLLVYFEQFFLVLYLTFLAVLFWLVFIVLFFGSLVTLYAKYKELKRAREKRLILHR